MTGGHNVPRLWSDQEKLEFARGVVKRQLKKLGLRLTYGGIKCIRKPRSVRDAEREANQEWGALFTAYDIGEPPKTYVLIQIFVLDFHDDHYATEEDFKVAIVKLLKHELLHLFYMEKYPETVKMVDPVAFEETFVDWVSRDTNEPERA